MTQWKYPSYLPKPPHLMSQTEWQSYQQGLTKQQKSDRYSGITSDLIPTFEMIQAQGLGEIDPDPYKRKSLTLLSNLDQSPWTSSFGSPATNPSSVDGLSQSRHNNSQEYVADGDRGRALPTDQTLNYLPTKREMDGHYLDGEGESITVPIDYLPLDEINWSKATEHKFSQYSPGFSGFFTDEVLVNFYGTRAGAVLGQMKFDLAGSLEVLEDGTYQFDGGADATGGGDMYNFEMHPGILAWPRNVKTAVGKPRRDRVPETVPQPFFIEIPGTYAIRMRGRF